MSASGESSSPHSQPEILGSVFVALDYKSRQGAFWRPGLLCRETIKNTLLKKAEMRFMH